MKIHVYIIKLTQFMIDIISILRKSVFRQKFFTFGGDIDVAIQVKSGGKPQHVGNISSAIPYMLRFSTHIWNGFYIK